MAMAAGVPIVPIVVRNSLDALPKNWVVVRPATVDVVVLPPIPPLLVGLIVFVKRRLREREGIAKTRMR